MLSSIFTQELSMPYYLTSVFSLLFGGSLGIIYCTTFKPSMRHLAIVTALISAFFLSVAVLTAG